MASRTLADAAVAGRRASSRVAAPRRARRDRCGVERVTTDSWLGAARIGGVVAGPCLRFGEVVAFKAPECEQPLRAQLLRRPARERALRRPGPLPRPPLRRPRLPLRHGR